jgi:CRP-like cAMP-binding protein
MEHFDAFQKNYLVLGLSADLAREVADLGEFKVATARDSLIRRGDASSDLYVILDGTVEVYTASGEVLAKVGPGAVIGEVALVDDQPRSADAVCTSTVKYVRLPSKELRQWMNAHREAGFVMLANLCRVLSARLRGVNLTVDDLARKTDDPWKFAL